MGTVTLIMSGDVIKYHVSKPIPVNLIKQTQMKDKKIRWPGEKKNLFSHTTDIQHASSNNSESVIISVTVTCHYIMLSVLSWIFFSSCASVTLLCKLHGLLIILLTAYFLHTLWPLETSVSTFILCLFRKCQMCDINKNQANVKPCFTVFSQVVYGYIH